MSSDLECEEFALGVSRLGEQGPGPAPPIRKWHNVAEPCVDRPTCIFSVFSYNVLCDKYATPQMYMHCPRWALDWNHRSRRIMSEIRFYGADIVTLQEVEKQHFKGLFVPQLRSQGYEGIFAPKSRAKTMSEEEATVVDGCAIFFNTDKFRLIKSHLFEFNQLAMAYSKGCEDMLNRVMLRDNVALVAILEPKLGAWDNGFPNKCPKIIVATSHIHWDPVFCDVKLIQTMMLMDGLKSIVETTLKTPFDDTYLLLCGDFNSLPDSGVIEFITNSRISSDHPDFKNLNGYKKCLHRISSNHMPSLLPSRTERLEDHPNLSEYTHAFHLSTAYPEKMMHFTNYTSEFRGIIDYIFYSTKNMKILGMLGEIDRTWFTKNKIIGAPNPWIPSDHFPLCVQLEITPAVEEMESVQVAECTHGLIWRDENDNIDIIPPFTLPLELEE